MGIVKKVGGGGRISNSKLFEESDIGIGKGVADGVASRRKVIVHGFEVKG